MDEILDDEEENCLDENRFGTGNISEIVNDNDDLSGMASSYDRSDTAFSIGQLARMTTIRRVFEEFKIDIMHMTFADLHELLKDTRDFSQESIKKLWSSTFNAPLEEGQSIEQTTLMCIEDSYDLVENENDCLVYNSSDAPDPQNDKLTIKQVLDQMGLLETTELDLFLSMSIELTLRL